MPNSAEPGTTPLRRGLVWSQIHWSVVIGIAALHVGCLAAPFTFTWSGLAVMAVLTWMTGGLGITLCYHRLLTHRSFKTPKWFEYVLTSIACMAWQGGPAQWVGVHRIHHAHSDEELDPHSPKHGFTWAHVLWCMHRDGENGQPGIAAAKDLMRDPVQRWLNNYFVVPQFALVALLVGLGWWIGGWPLAASWVVWGVCVRTVLVYHGTWFVNSASHTWGYRNFDTTDHSTNLWWVAVLSFGEGWHNNHHAQQRSAAHGMRWWEFDLTWQTIKVLRLVGLAWDVVEPDLAKLGPAEFAPGKAAAAEPESEATTVLPLPTKRAMSAG